MITVNLNWEWFILTCTIIGITRLLFLRFLPLKLISITTAATVGFGFFLVLPILGYSNFLTISVWEYSCSVWLAYLSFLVGATIARQLLGENKVAKSAPRQNVLLSNFALVYCITWVLILLFEFFQIGGFGHMRDVIFGGWAHYELLAQIGGLMQYNPGLSFFELGKIFLDNVFLCLWVLVYIRMPKGAMLIWVVYILTNLGEYISHAALLGLILIPFLTYVMLNRPSLRRVTLTSGILLIVTLIFSSSGLSCSVGVKRQYFQRTGFFRYDEGRR